MQTVVYARHRQGTDGHALIHKDCDQCAPGMSTETLGSVPAVLQAVPHALVLAGANGDIIFANKRVERLFGYGSFELLGKPCALLIAERFRSSFAREHERYVGNSSGRQMSKDTELRGRHKNGREFPLQMHFGVVARNPHCSLISFCELTDREELKAKQRQAQKMEIVGMLTSGVAHDFNNLLTVINGFAEILSKEFRGNDSACSMLQEIRDAGQRGASLNRQLMAFSRQEVVEPRVLNLNDVIADTKKMLGRLIGEDIALVTVLEPALGPIKADPGQIEQAILNLAVNARDAMPCGGTLTIATANAELDDNDAESHPGASPGRYVLLAVTDTGCGMDEQTKARAFDPFFTTKEQGKGTGLGLATIQRIVKENGGHIAVSSELAQGATFQLFLPRVAEAMAGMECEAVCQQTKLRGGETVLIVEDDDSVRGVMRRVLQDHGYTVLEAQKPGQALELFARNHSVHMLVADLILPEMTGRDLARKLVAEKPTLRVLYVSGYPNGTRRQDESCPNTTPLLMKPFTPMALVQRMREVLDA